MRSGKLNSPSIITRGGRGRAKVKVELGGKGGQKGRERVVCKCDCYYIKRVSKVNAAKWQLFPLCHEFLNPLLIITITEITPCTITEITQCTITENTRCTIMEITLCTITEITQCTITEITQCTITEITQCTITEITRCTITEITQCTITEITQCTITPRRIFFTIYDIFYMFSSENLVI